MPLDNCCHLKLYSLSNGVVSCHRSCRSSIHFRTKTPLLPGTITYLYFVQDQFIFQYSLANNAASDFLSRFFSFLSPPTLQGPNIRVQVSAKLTFTVAAKLALMFLVDQLPINRYFAIFHQLPLVFECRWRALQKNQMCFDLKAVFRQINFRPLLIVRFQESWVFLFTEIARPNGFFVINQNQKIYLLFAA